MRPLHTRSSTVRSVRPQPKQPSTITRPTTRTAAAARTPTSTPKSPATLVPPESSQTSVKFEEPTSQKSPHKRRETFFDPTPFEPSEKGGHVFITQGYVSEVAVDAFWVSTNDNLDLNETWVEVLGDEFVKNIPPPPEGWKEQKQRVLAMPPRVGNGRGWRARQWIFLVNFRGMTHNAVESSDPLESVLDLYEQVITEFVAMVVKHVGCQGPSLFGRPKKLIGIPLAGTSANSSSPLKNHVGRAIQKILPLLQQSAAKHDLDFILGTGSGKPKYAAVQSSRARSNPTEFEGLLSPELLRHGSRLAKLAANGELALFIGAGVSVGCGLPLWKDLLHNLAVEAGMTQTEIAEIDDMNSLDAAKIIEERFGDRTQLVTLVSQQLQSEHYSVTHCLLASLPCREVITTNYDTSFERACWDIGTQRLAVIPYYPRRDCERWLLKMHGCVTSPGDIVLTREDYIRYSEKNQALAGIVQSILIQKHMLFIGFSLVDDNFHKIMDSVRRTRTAQHDLEDPKVLEKICRAYAGLSTKQLKVADRLKFKEEESTGTILSLFPHPLMDAYWRQLFDLLNMTSQPSNTGKGERIRESVRVLELFLDYIALEVSKLTTVDNLLLPHFESTLDADERLVRYAVLNFVENFPTDGLHTTAWDKIRGLLCGMGGNQIVQAREFSSQRKQSLFKSMAGQESAAISDLILESVLKYDHFENIHQLVDAPVVFNGAPNFRKVPGYPVFGMGQPTFGALASVVTYLCEVHKLREVMWIMLRQEPVIYVNGQSFTPRKKNRLNENISVPNPTPQLLSALQEDFVRVVRNRMSANGNDVVYYRDTYGEHPDDRKNTECTMSATGPMAVLSVSALAELCRATGHNVHFERFPIVDETAPDLADFDGITQFILSHPKGTACLFNCQMGKGRTTCGMIIACLVHRASHEPVKTETAPSPQHIPDELSSGLFGAVKQFLQLHPKAPAAKEMLDELVDLCGPPTGLQNLRECIVWTRNKFEAEPEHKKMFWQHMGRNFLKRYVVLLCFALYILDQKPTLATSFQDWVASKTTISALVEMSFDDFKWE